MIAAALLSLSITDIRIETGHGTLRTESVVAGVTVGGPVRATAHKAGSQYALGGEYVRGFGPLTLGLGAVYLRHTDWLNGSRANFSLYAGYDIGPWSIQWRHWSNAGTKRPNRGSDFLLIGYRF